MGVETGFSGARASQARHFRDAVTRRLELRPACRFRSRFVKAAVQKLASQKPCISEASHQKPCIRSLAPLKLGLTARPHHRRHVLQPGHRRLPRLRAFGARRLGSTLRIRTDGLLVRDSVPVGGVSSTTSAPMARGRLLQPELRERASSTRPSDASASGDCLGAFAGRGPRPAPHSAAPLPCFSAESRNDRTTGKYMFPAALIDAARRPSEAGLPAFPPVRRPLSGRVRLTTFS